MKSYFVAFSSQNYKFYKILSPQVDNPRNFRFLKRIDKKVDSIHITPPKLWKESDVDSGEDGEALVGNLNKWQLQAEVEAIFIDGEQISSNNDVIDQPAQEIENASEPSPRLNPLQRFKFQK